MVSSITQCEQLVSLFSHTHGLHDFLRYSFNSFLRDIN